MNNACAACHARRGTIGDRDRPGAPLTDTHRLALLTAPNDYADRRHPYDLDLLGALVSFEREGGDTRAELGHARKLVEALPDDPQVKALVDEFARGRGQSRND